MQLLHYLFFGLVQYEFSLRAIHIAGKMNVGAEQYPEII